MLHSYMCSLYVCVWFFFLRCCRRRHKLFLFPQTYRVECALSHARTRNRFCVPKQKTYVISCVIFISCVAMDSLRCILKEMMVWKIEWARLRASRAVNNLTYFTFIWMCHVSFVCPYDCVFNSFLSLIPLLALISFHFISILWTFVVFVI